ncbi:MAG: MFS transporter [Candidatus Aminicenantes bacterium]|nr:MFS transporter [Candidatus Aminicenantes bacterium]
MGSGELRPAGHKKTLRTFAAASFLNDMGSDIIYPVWPLFVTEFLKAKMTVLGFIDGLGDALVSLSQAASGYASDKLKRRKIFIWTGYLCGSISRLGYAVSTVWTQLVPFKMLDRIGKIRSAPRDAAVADLSTDGNRGRNFGLLRTMDNLGAFVGILVCLALFPLFGYRRLFALAAIPSLVGAALIIINIRETRPSERKIFKGMSLRRLDGNLKLYIVLNAVFALGSFSYSFLLIQAKRSGSRAGFVPVLYLIYAAAATAGSLPFGRLSDKVGRKPVLFLSFGVWGALCLGVLAAKGPGVGIAVFVLFGIHKAALDPVQRALVAELCPPAFRASALGAFQMIIGLCAFPASFLAGLLWETLGPAAPFALSLGLTALAGLLLAFVNPPRPSKSALP